MGNLRMAGYDLFLAYLVGLAAMFCSLLWSALRWNGSHDNPFLYWLGVMIQTEPWYVFVRMGLLLSVFWPLLVFVWFCITALKVYVKLVN